jgi:hypothetical protein
MSSEKEVICLVCGKKFPRGPVDRERHITAVTLQHLVSKKAKPGYSHQCSKCSIYFGSKEHLDMHSKLVCSSTRSKQKVIAASVSSVPIKAKLGVKKEVTADAEESSSVDEARSERTMECMVCGKLFPRGPVDLARHQFGKVYSYVPLSVNIPTNTSALHQTF